MNDDSNSEISALRKQGFILLIALIVISGTLTAYLYRQASLAHKDYAASERLVNGYSAGEPAVLTFVNQLGAYSVTHTDIRPITAKYGIVSAVTQPGANALKK